MKAKIGTRILAAALAISLLCGCGDRSIKETYIDIFGPEPPAESAPAETAEITELSLPYNINDSLYPYTASTEMNKSIIPLIYDPLFKIDEELKAQPCLAKSVSGSGTAYTVTLRDDVFFSNGKAVVADDVIYSYGQTQLRAKEYWQLHTSVKSAEKVGDNQILFTLYRADKNMAALLSFPIVQNGDSGGEIIGTGRYTLKQAGGLMSLEANMGNSETSQKIRTIELVTLPNNESVANALKVGMIDCIFTSLNMLEDYGIGSKSYPVESGNAVYLGFNRTNKILADQRVRGLVDQMINKQSIATDCYFNKAVAANTPFNPAYYDLPESSRPTLSEELMHIYLEEAGLKMDEATGKRMWGDEPAKFTILVNSDNSIRTEAANQVARNISAYGIDVTVEGAEYSTYLQRLAVGSYDMFVAEVRLSDNQDLSQMLSGTSIGILNDAYDSNVIDSYYKYCAETITCEEFLNVFYSYQPVSVLVYRQGAVMVPKSFMGKMVATNQDIFYNIAKW